MLVLSRGRGEKVIIRLPDNREVEITVVEIKGQKTRLGIEAPTDLLVHRKEIYERIKREKG